MSVDGRTARAERRRADARERLLAAVGTLLGGGRSYADISVEDLAREAGLSRSMFYAYFEDKGALVSAWFDSVAEEVEQAAAAWWELASESSRDDLLRAITHMVGAFEPYAPLMVAMHDAAGYDETVRGALDGMLARSIAGLHEHIERGQAEGWIVAGLPASETAGWLTCLAESGQQRIEQHIPPAERAPIIDASVEIIWRTLYADAPSRRATG